MDIKYLPQSTRLLLLAVGIVGLGLGTAFIGNNMNKESESEKEIEEYLTDSVLTNEQSINEINSIEDEQARLEALEGNLQNASRTISDKDSDNVLGKTLVDKRITDTSGTTLYIVFDKSMEDVEEHREQVVEYAEETDSLPLQTIYMNVEASYIEGRYLYTQLKDVPITNDFVFPAAFIVQEGQIVWEDVNYESLPTRSDFLE